MSNIEKMSNVVQAEMDFKVTENESRMLVQIATCWFLVTKTRIALENQKSIDPLAILLCHCSEDTVKGLYVETVRASGKSETIMRPAMDCALKLVLKRYEERERLFSNRASPNVA